MLYDHKLNPPLKKEFNKKQVEKPLIVVIQTMNTKQTLMHLQPRQQQEGRPLQQEQGSFFPG